MALSKYNKYITEHPDKDKKISNVEFTLKSIDNVMDEHTNINPIDHPDSSITTSKIANKAVTTDKIADLNVTHEKLNSDMNLHGKVVIVDTPFSSDTGGGGGDSSVIINNTYTKEVIDSKINAKADKIHNHTTSDITDFPTVMKNPKALIINGEIYDGSSEMNITAVSIADANTLSNNIDIAFNLKADKSYIDDNFYTNSEIDNLMSDKSEIEHIHNDLSTKEYVDDEIQELKNMITELTERLEHIEEKLKEEIIEIEESEGDD